MNRIEYNINMHNNDMQLDDIGEALFKLSQKNNVLVKAKYKDYIFTTDDIKNVKSVKEAQIRINKLFLDYTINSLQKMVYGGLSKKANVVKLKDVSSNLVLFFNDEEINALVKAKQADSVEDVLNLIEEYPSYDWRIVKYNIAKVQRNVSLANKKGYQPLKFYTHGYEDEKLASQDTFNYGNILLLDNPTNSNPTRFNDLKNKTINQIKKDLAHVNAFGTNYVASSVYDYRNIGLDNISKILYALEQYETQIVRQSYLRHNEGDNLFELNKNEKLAIVSERYDTIIRYLINHVQEEFIWHKVTKSQKELYLSSTINMRESDYMLKENVLKYIANYITLPEAKEIAKTDLSVLKRFIVK